jgi:acyl dehydratase
MMEKYYKLAGNPYPFHIDEDHAANLISAGAVEITEAEADELRKPPPIPASEQAMAEITAMEREQMLPRVTREFMLGFMESTFTPEQLALNLGYTKVKAFDEQIKVLRAQL